MQSVDLVRYKYEIGAWSLSYLASLVKINQLTEKDFFEITRKYFQSIKKQGITEK